MRQCLFHFKEGIAVRLASTCSEKPQLLDYYLVNFRGPIVGT